ncbi:MAG: glycosyltransferase family 39 protein [Blastocatellia bacterium]
MRASPSSKFSVASPETRFDRTTVLKLFAALAVITFLLRIFYSGQLYEDDGLWFTAAEEILRGRTLYREIYFDKPPAIALVYAGLFKLFGAHILTIRLFTIICSITISIVLYLFGKQLYDRRTGLLAAAMFTIFSTTYQEGHFQGLNTDFLMALPYTAGAYLLTRARADNSIARRLSFCGGMLIGIASQINPKAAFNIVFFALFLFLARKWQTGGERTGGVSLFAFALAGLATGALPFLIYIAATKSFSFYWLYVWDWGARYARYYPAWKTARSALTQSFDYFAGNNTLLIALVFVVISVIKRSGSKQGDTEAASTADFRADVTLLIWLGASYAGLAVGGRFFGHYFFQILPALCLIGARGIIGIVRLRNQTTTRKWNLRRALMALLAVGFIVTLVRYHSRTAILAADWVRGSKSAATLEWFHEKLNREERMVATAVRSLDDELQTPDQMTAEAMRADSPRERGAEGPADYLFVWGYRPEIYYWSGLIPASKYLSTQMLTGVPADVHYFGDEYHSVLEESVTRAARAELAQELEQVRPRYIVDELGFFNTSLAFSSYPEFREIISGYRNVGVIERFIIYHRRDFVKNHRRNSPDAR